MKEKTKASLGLSNISQITPESPQTRIIICADHDAPDSSASKSLDKSVKILQEKGFQVTLVKPDMLCEDFNDVLKAQGPEGVRDVLERDLPREFESSFINNVPFSHKTPEKKLESTLLETKENSFDEIMKRCEKHLFNYLNKKNKSATPELKERITNQSERAAEYIFYAHVLKGTTPTQEETKLFLLRAKYELDRIPEIRRTIMKGWQSEDSFDEKKDGLIAHMIAERQASIEGRLYFEAKQCGANVSSNIPDLAAKELNNHRSQTTALAERISEKYALSKNAALDCVRDILRYKEAHGEKPSRSQITKMVQISKELEKKNFEHPLKDFGSHEIEFLRRKEGDYLFRQIALQNKTHIVPNDHYIQMQEKSVITLESISRQVI